MARIAVLMASFAFAVMLGAASGLLLAILFLPVAALLAGTATTVAFTA